MVVYLSSDESRQESSSRDGAGEVFEAGGEDPDNKALVKVA